MKNNSQLVNFLLIAIGGVLLLFEISGEKDNIYLLVIGIILLMFGLYRATNHWVYTKDDHKINNDEDKDLNV